MNLFSIVLLVILIAYVCCMAYAHNKDDFIETALMSLIYEGRFYAFPPVTELPEAGVTVIRPMMWRIGSISTFTKAYAG